MLKVSHTLPALLVIFLWVEQLQKVVLGCEGVGPGIKLQRKRWQEQESERAAFEVENARKDVQEHFRNAVNPQKPIQMGTPAAQAFFSPPAQETHVVKPKPLPPAPKLISSKNIPPPPENKPVFLKKVGCIGGFDKRSG